MILLAGDELAINAQKTKREFINAKKSQKKRDIILLFLVTQLQTITANIHIELTMC